MNSYEPPPKFTKKDFINNFTTNSHQQTYFKIKTKYNYAWKNLIYTGNGEGKTTASLGHAVRFAGYGKRVAISHNSCYTRVRSVSNESAVPPRISERNPQHMTQEIPKDHSIKTLRMKS
ncbi:MAG: cob(I)yrinic acid a,c-diamide adenosyltransferase [Candidatus Aenigmarchaeota archaeon]|nr:cob(I)yrinic acid a,c-diamide adenosyltransferase [Candidatus Aenigmarchaeota archaeon]